MSVSSKRREGYLLIDNRFGPGVSADFIRATGKDAPIVGEGRLYESATKTCRHCQTVVILNPDRSRPRGYCRKCDDYICDNPACNFECTPIKKVLDDAQEQSFRNEMRGVTSDLSFSLNHLIKKDPING